MKAKIEPKEKPEEWLSYKDVKEEGWYIENHKSWKILFLRSHSTSLGPAIAINDDGDTFRIVSDHNWWAQNCRFQKLDISVTLPCSQ